MERYRLSILWGIEMSKNVLKNGAGNVQFFKKMPINSCMNILNILRDISYKNDENLVRHCFVRKGRFLVSIVYLTHVIIERKTKNKK